MTRPDSWGTVPIDQLGMRAVEAHAVIGVRVHAVHPEEPVALCDMWVGFPDNRKDVGRYDPRTDDSGWQPGHKMCAPCRESYSQHRHADEQMNSEQRGEPGPDRDLDAQERRIEM